MFSRGFLADLDDGDPVAWAIAIVAGYFLVYTWRNVQATGTGNFPDQAPAAGAVDQAIDIIAPMRTSPAGQAFIKEQEGWTAQPKKDAAGQEVGWGHTIRAGDNLTYPLSKAVGEQLFASDVANAEAIVNGAVTVALTQNQFDALVDLAFDSGYAAFGQNSTLITKLNQGDYAGAAQAFALYDKSQGRTLPALQQRRGEEAGMFGQ
jgi:lysozyme